MARMTPAEARRALYEGTRQLMLGDPEYFVDILCNRCGYDIPFDTNSREYVEAIDQIMKEHDAAWPK